MNNAKKTWRDLIVWQKSHQLVLDIHTILKNYPAEERFALADQTRRSALSVPTNIVEGQARNSSKDFIRFLIIARSSLEELRYLLIVALDLKYIKQNNYQKTESLAQEISIMLNKLISKIAT